MVYGDRRPRGHHRLQYLEVSGNNLIMSRSCRDSRGSDCPLNVRPDVLRLVVATNKQQSCTIADRRCQRPRLRILAWESPGRGTEPVSIAVDDQDYVSVVDHANQRVEMFASAGHFLAVWNDRYSIAGRNASPTGIAVGEDGNIHTIASSAD